MGIVWEIWKKSRGAAIVLALGVFTANAQSSEIEDVVKAASQALPEWLSRIPAGMEASYGFDDRNDFEIAEVGAPYRMCTVNDGSRWPDSPPTARQFAYLNQWRVPVLVRGQARALITIMKSNGVLQAVDFGATDLARELASCEMTLPAPGTKRNRALLRLYEFQADFLVAAQDAAIVDSDTAVPLFQAAQALGLEEHQQSLTVSELKAGILRQFETDPAGRQQ